MLMLAAAGMSLVRGFVVAGLLDPEDFTRYAVAVATGTFLSNFLSFGLIEGTIKQFPRMTVSGSAGALLSLSDGAIRRLAFRAALCAPLFAVVMWVIDRDRPMVFLAVTTIAFCVAVLGLLASVQRALLNVLNIAVANGLRASLYLALAATGAFAFGLRGAIVGEIVAALLGAIVSREIFKATLRSRALQTADAPLLAENVKAEHGVTLFIAYSAIAAPIYMDRAYVAAVFSPADGAAYAVLALFVTGATVFVNIVGQKVGPEIIAREKSGATAAELVFGAARWSAAVVAIWLLVIAALHWAMAMGLLPFLDKYGITPVMLLAIAFTGCMQVASLFEFILIARDMERKMLVLSLIYLGAVCLTGALAHIAGLSLAALVALLGAVKLLYLILIVLTLHSSRGQSGVSASVHRERNL
jgi:O-antigen/teichoic acid export membrane protein